MEINKAIRVAHFPGAISGGVGSVILNLMRNFEHSRAIFDFFVSTPCPAEIEREINSYGGKITLIPKIRQIGPLRYIKHIRNLLSKEQVHYDAVHIHSIHMGALTAIAAKLARVPKILYHVHNTSDPALTGFFNRYIVSAICKYIIKTTVTHKIACGTDAGKYIYGKSPFKVLYNGVDTTRFKPQRIPNPYKESDEIIVGNVARFVALKNQQFLIDIAKSDIKGRCKFLLVGDGPTFSEVKQKVDNAGLSDRFIFLGQQRNLEALYNYMDVFVLPSFFEGFPVTTVEAQACGLPCITSVNVTDESDLGVTAYSRLPFSADLWTNEIYSMENKRIFNTDTILDSFHHKGFDIKDVTDILLRIYQQ